MRTTTIHLALAALVPPTALLACDSPGGGGAAGTTTFDRDTSADSAGSDADGASSDADGPRDTTTPSGGVISEARRRAVARIQGCTSVDGVMFAAHYIPFDYAAGVSLFRDLPEEACVNSAVDCAGVLTCRGYRVTPCDPEVEASTCDGATELTCEAIGSRGQTAQRTVDCAAEVEGGTCDPGYGATSDLGACVGALCNAGSRCDGDDLVQCVAGREQRFHCGAFSDTCQADEGDAGCAFETDSDEPCERTAACTGSVFRICGNGGKTVGSFDCARLGDGFTCIELPNDSADCGAAPGELVCNPLDDYAVCDGTTARYCLNGLWLTFDCGSLAGGACSDGSCVVSGWTAP